MSKRLPHRNPTEQNVTTLQNRNKELEKEVSTLKARLDELRKAKNNTITKREREVIHVGEPGLGRPVGVETAKYRELEKKFLEAQSKINAFTNGQTDNALAKSNAEKSRDEWKRKYEKLESDVNTLQMNHEIELGQSKAKVREKNAEVEDMTTELQRLRERLEVKAMQEEHKGRENTDREGHISTLTNDNAYLREKIESLFMELSIKEAKWLEREDKLKTEVKTEWEQRYREWMSNTEKKLAELHEANQMLKSCLYKGERRHNNDLKGFDESDEGGGSNSTK